MKPLISPRAMRECELTYFRESGVRSIDIMERAAEALAEAVRSGIPEGSDVYFACGSGGNGGDGTACARLLSNRYRCRIILPKEPQSPDAVENLRRAREMDIPVLSDADDLPVPAAWVDALFGTGLSRAPSGAEAALISRINTHGLAGAKIFSADIPSGLSGATGQAFDSCIVADRTVSFQYLKTGLVLADGLDVCGKISVPDVSFPPEAFAPSVFDAKLIEPSDLPKLLPPRPRNIHKGRCGHLLIVAGSLGMAGAAAMCALAALRSGAGLVTVACPEPIVPVLQTLAPQAMCISLPDDRGALSAKALPLLQDALRNRDAVVIGPGLTRRVPPEILRAVLESPLPAVIDADALNIVSGNPDLAALLTERHIITPHPGEAARLVPDISLSDPVAAARRLCGPCTALYKGAACVIASPQETYISASGCCGMARGGSGDILSGILGALIAEKSDRSPALSAAAASEIHGLAGERAQQKYGSRAMNAMDILEFLPEVFG